MIATSYEDCACRCQGIDGYGSQRRVEAWKESLPAPYNPFPRIVVIHHTSLKHLDESFLDIGWHFQLFFDVIR
jgi:hypothetical protein